MTTIAQFVATLSGLTVSGVATTYTEPPAQLGVLPCQYPRLPRLTGGVYLSRDRYWNSVLTGELIVVVEAVSQNRATTNFALAMTLMDNLDAALKTAFAANSGYEWTISQEYLTFGSDKMYWALVATVTQNGPP